MASTFPTTSTLLSSTNHLTSRPPSTVVTTSKPHPSFPVHRTTSTQFTYHPKRHLHHNNNRAGIRSWRNNVSFFPNFLTKPKDNDSLKEELFEAIASLDRGAEATLEEQEAVDKIASELEKVNRIKEPLKSDLLNGKWELLYTTSQSILGTQRPKFLRPNGKIYQAINVDTLRAQNIETWPFFNQVFLCP